MTERASGKPKPLVWLGSSKKGLLALPDEVIDEFGVYLIKNRLKVAARHAKELEDEQT